MLISPAALLWRLQALPAVEEFQVVVEHADPKDLFSRDEQLVRIAPRSAARVLPGTHADLDRRAGLRPVAAACAHRVPRHRGDAGMTGFHREDLEPGRRFDTYGRTITEGDLSFLCAFAS